MSEAERQNKVIGRTSAVGAGRKKASARVRRIVSDHELVLQKLKIDISSAIVALTIPRNHDPGVAIGVLGNMKQGIVDIYLVTYWTE